MREILHTACGVCTGLVLIERSRDENTAKAKIIKRRGELVHINTKLENSAGRQEIADAPRRLVPFPRKIEKG